MYPRTAYISIVIHISQAAMSSDAQLASGELSGG